MMNNKSVLFFPLLFYAMTMVGQINHPGQANRQTPFVLGVVDKIQSRVLGESRILNIYLPEGYSPDSAKEYPVIYLLDGSANEDFIHLTGIVQFLTMIELMPQSIVVGIANIDRRRDFTFPTTIAEDKKNYPTTGNSARFMTFVEKELQPFIQSRYKVNKVRTLIGQSLGGLFATELLLKKPFLFDNYFIISPSLWWDNESLLTIAAGLWEKQDDRQRHVYISFGQEGQQMEKDVKRLAEILASKKDTDIDLFPFPEETHLTILHNSVYKGLQLLYSRHTR